MRIVSTQRLALYSMEYAVVGIFSILIIILAARTNSVGDLGAFAFVLALVSLQLPLAAFGTPALIYGRTARAPDSYKRVLSKSVSISIVLSLVVFAFTLVTLLISHGPQMASLYTAAGIRLLNAPALVLTSDAQARHAIGEYLPFRLFAASGAIAAATIAFVVDAPIVTFAVIWGIDGALFCLLLLVAAYRRRRLLGFDLSRWQPIAAKAAPLAIQSLFVVTYLRFDQIYIQFRFGEVALGTYAAAARIAEIGNMVFSVVVLLITPHIINTVTQDGRINGKAASSLFSIALIAGVIAYAAWQSGDIALSMIFGEAYRDGSNIMAVYILSTPFVAYGSIASRTLVSLGLTKKQALAAAIGAMLNIGLSVGFGELFGMTGVAFATVVSYASVSAILMFYINQAIKRQNG